MLSKVKLDSFILKECHSRAADGINCYKKKHKERVIKFLFWNYSGLSTMSTNVGPTRYSEREWLALRWHMQGLLDALRALGQPRTNSWQLSWPDEQNDIGPTSFVNVGPTKLSTKYKLWATEWLLLGTNLASAFPNLKVHIN